MGWRGMASHSIPSRSIGREPLMKRRNCGGSSGSTAPPVASLASMVTISIGPLRKCYDRRMILGADTLVPVTDAIVSMVRNRFGAPPQFWGRYFKRPGFEQDYQPATENRVFTENSIRLLPIARQTNRVAGTATQGAEDALLNVDAFTKALR